MPARTYRPVLLFAVAAIFIALTFALAAHVRHEGPGLSIDSTVANYFNQHATPGVTSLVVALTFFGSGPFLTAATALASGYFAWRRLHRTVAALVLIMAGGALINVTIKHTVQRTRPFFEQPVMTLSTFSFPSAHAMGATLFYGWLAMTVAATARTRWAKALIYAAAVVAVIVIAMTRLYLGLHFVSDVLGGTFVGIAWLAIVAAAFRALPLARGERRIA